MDKDQKVRIDVEAAKALSKWRSRFADDVCEAAKRLATQTDSSNYVTLAHYRQAAEIALRSLSEAIRCEDKPDAERAAA